MTVTPVDLVVANGTLVDAFGTYPDTAVAVAGGRVQAVGRPAVMPPARQTIDAAGRYVLPGVVDTHVHFREPGMGYKEGYETGSGAAALGGVTCVFDMPNTDPPTDTAQRLHDKLALVRGRSWVDYAMYGLLGPGDPGDLTGLADAGVIGVKAFLGQSETGTGCPSPPDDGALYEGMGLLAAAGVRLAVHAENHAMMRRWIGRLRGAGADGLDAHRRSRPPVVEVEAVRRAGLFARYTGCAVHVVHLSSAEGVDAVRRVRAEGVDMTCETCPHYLVDLGARPALRVNPPVRGEADRIALAAALVSGDVDYVASDHAPHDRSEKCGTSVWEVRPGLAGVQHTLQIMWDRRTELGLSPPDIVRLTSFRPARVWGLWPRKGALVPGADADLVVLDPAHRWTIDAATGHTRHGSGPYAGLSGTGAPVVTVLRGTVVARDGQLVGRPFGAFLAADRTQAEPVSATSSPVSSRRK